tara:strand:+ start:847 stop:1023 length:177 start_codon:yes stop_codon:yes gene_type:complete
LAGLLKNYMQKPRCRHEVAKPLGTRLWTAVWQEFVGTRQEDKIFGVPSAKLDKPQAMG